MLKLCTWCGTVHEKDPAACPKKKAPPIQSSKETARRRAREHYRGEWSKRRAEQIKAAPYCELCGWSPGAGPLKVPAGRGNGLEVDHKERGNPASELQTLCVSCHRVKSREESRKRMPFF